MQTSKLTTAWEHYGEQEGDFENYCVELVYKMIAMFERERKTRDN